MNTRVQETIAVRLTGKGRSAVATVLVEGPLAANRIDACFLAAARLPAAALQLNRTYFGTWHWRGHAEELVVCRLHEQRFEVHCHGGKLASENILASLNGNGVSVIGAEAWLELEENNAFVLAAKKILPAVRTKRTLRIVLDQIQGAMERQLQRVLAAVRQREATLAMQLVTETLLHAKLGLRIGSPWSVVLCGAPNAGKSSLINALVGFERAVVNDQPGTTRDLVTAEAAVDGWPLVFTDTAGVRVSDDLIESTGIELAKSRMATAHLILHVIDMSASHSPELELPSNVAVLRIGTKCDLVHEATESSQELDATTSATQGHGIETLLRLIAKALCPVEPEPGTAVPMTSDQVDDLQALLRLLGAGELAAAESHLTARVALNPDV